MSRVTNLMLTCSVMEHDSRRDRDGDELGEPLRQVREWCRGKTADPDCPRRDLMNLPLRVDDEVGGPKHIECSIYIWAANWLNLEGFLEAVRTAPWRCPEDVQVFVQGQEESRFTVYNLGDNAKWRKLT